VNAWPLHSSKAVHSALRLVFLKSGTPIVYRLGVDELTDRYQLQVISESLTLAGYVSTYNALALTLRARNHDARTLRLIHEYYSVQTFNTKLNAIW